MNETTLKDLMSTALVLGAERAQIIDTSSVVVEDWVIWKCRYGCPLYDKDSLHPPCAPGPESTKKVLEEYSQAILLNGSKGKKLSEVALKLEGEAYQAGYYKAFAMIALPTASDVLPESENAAEEAT